MKKWEHGRDPSQWRTTRKYMARPMAGIWASAPYLHNGSVPTLYDLLSTERPKEFRVGQREFDSIKVGCKEVPAETPNTALFDTKLPGNSNAGHSDYTPSFSHEEKLDLIEYLKSL